jgi:hypothetical protein
MIQDTLGVSNTSFFCDCFLLLDNCSVWHQLSNQVYLGVKAFLDRVWKYLPTDNGDIQIPRTQRRPLARSLVEYESESDSRNSAIRIVYASGAYSHPGGYWSKFESEWDRAFLIDSMKRSLSS